MRRKTSVRKPRNEVDCAVESRGDKRRNCILRALRECVIKDGYPKTTLADIARAADMSPSHLLYYYEGKDAILVHYFRNVADSFLERVDRLRAHSTEHQLENLAELFFAARGITKSEIGFMLECFGVAVNHPELRREKARMDERCKGYLTELFEKTPRRSDLSARDSAEVAFALLVGLRTAVYFSEHLSLTEAQRLFRLLILDLAGELREERR